MTFPIFFSKYTLLAAFQYHSLIDCKYREYSKRRKLHHFHVRIHIRLSNNLYLDDASLRVPNNEIIVFIGRDLCQIVTILCRKACFLLKRKRMVLIPMIDLFFTSLYKFLLLEKLQIFIATLPSFF